MPCNDNGWSQDIERQELNEIIRNSKRMEETVDNIYSQIPKIKQVLNAAVELRNRNDQLAKMLCGIMNSLTYDEDKQYVFSKVAGLKLWWDMHQIYDHTEKLNRNK